MNSLAFRLSAVSIVKGVNALCAVLNRPHEKKYREIVVMKNKTQYIRTILNKIKFALICASLSFVIAQLAHAASNGEAKFIPTIFPTLNWTLVGSLAATFAGDLSPVGLPAVVAAADNKIYFGPTTNTDSKRFFRYFDLDIGIFAGPLALPPLASSDFCACGFREVMLSNGIDLFMMGNDGYRYETSTNKWIPLANYAAVMRGEAAGTYDASSQLFLMIGGRGRGDTEETTAIRMSYSTFDTFSAEPGTLPVPMSSAVAFTQLGTLSYIAGGIYNGGVALLSHATNTATWTRLPDATSSLGNPYGIGKFDGLVWVARSDKVFVFFDPPTNTWTDHEIAAPAGFLGVVTWKGEVYAIGQVDDTSDVTIHRLTKNLVFGDGFESK